MTTMDEMAARPTIFAALAAVMGEVQSIGKDGRNERDGYAFRGIDSTMNAVGPALRRHGVIVVPTVEDVTYETVEIGRNRTTMRECTVRVRFTFYGPDGSSVECTTAGEAMDVADKSASKAQSVAMRVALLQALCVPTGDEDPDATTHKRSPRRASTSDTPPPNDRQPKRPGQSPNRKRMFALLREFDDTLSRDESLKLLGEQVGRTLTSTNDLDESEVSTVNDWLAERIAARRAQAEGQAS